MTRTKKVLIGLGVVIGILAAMALLGRKSVHAELVIPASPEAIWAVLTDGPSYAEWNPVLVDAKGDYREGGSLTYQMKDGKGGQTEVVSTVVVFDPNRELNQFGGMRGILTFDHHWVLEPVSGGTRVTQHEDYRGIGVWFWDPSWFQTAYASANEALRDHVAALQERP